MGGGIPDSTPRKRLECGFSPRQLESLPRCAAIRRLGLTHRGWRYRWHTPTVSRHAILRGLASCPIGTRKESAHALRAELRIDETGSDRVPHSYPSAVSVTDLDDPRIACYRNLRTSGTQRRHGLFIAEGMWVTRRLLASRYQTHSVLIEQRRLPELGVPVPDNVPVYVVPDGLVEQIIGFAFHRGVLAAGYRQKPPDLDQLAGLEQHRWMIVACDEVQDPENLGSILRSCAALGIAAVLLGPGSADYLSRRVIRVSMATALQIPVIESRDLKADLAKLRDLYGAQIAATVLDDRATPLDEFTRPDRLVLVFGSEGHGLSPDWKTFSDHLLTIPMDTRADSLNVAVACGIFLYWLARR